MALLPIGMSMKEHLSTISLLKNSSLQGLQTLMPLLHHSWDLSPRKDGKILDKYSTTETRGVAGQSGSSAKDSL